MPRTPPPATATRPPALSRPRKAARLATLRSTRATIAAGRRAHAGQAGTEIPSRRKRTPLLASQRLPADAAEIRWPGAPCAPQRVRGPRKGPRARRPIPLGVIFSVWTIENFTRESVILHRRDTNGFDVVYAGQISKEGGSLVNQTANGNFDAAGITWGPKLNSIPGSNAERDRLRGTHPQPQVVVAPVVVCVPWFFGMVCAR